MQQRGTRLAAALDTQDIHTLTDIHTHLRIGRDINTFTVPHTQVELRLLCRVEDIESYQ